MSKNPNSKSKPVKREEPLNGTMKLFLAGCVAELYLLVVRRFYVSGTIEQFVAWHGYLLYVCLLGLAAAAAGVVLLLLRKSKHRVWGWSLVGAGVFLALSAWITRFFGATALTLMCVLVPVAMLLGVLWRLYDRECAWSLTILAVTLVALWLCRRLLDSIYLSLPLKLCVVLYLIFLAAVVLVAKRADQNGGKLSKLQLLPASADPLPIYGACGISAIALILALFSTGIAYYAIWVVAVVIFALAVYYTVKQL